MKKIVALLVTGVMLVGTCLSAVASEATEAAALSGASGTEGVGEAGDNGETEAKTKVVETKVETGEEDAAGVGGIAVEENDTDESGERTEDESGEKTENGETGGKEQGSEPQTPGGTDKQDDDREQGAEDHGKRTMETTGLVNQRWQVELTFPHWVGAIDDTLVINDAYAFEFYKDQGYIEVKLNSKVTGFDLFINNKKVVAPKKSGRLDIAKYTVNGRNTIRVANIRPLGLENAVKVLIPYPTVSMKKVEPSKVGIEADAFKFIEQIVKADVAHGYTGAQLAVVKDGKLVYSGAWGYVNAYDGEQKTSEFRDEVTTETLYDLSGVSSAYTAAAILNLVSEGKLSLSSKVVDVLGEEFVDKTVEMDFYAADADFVPSLATIREWKREMTVGHLLRYQSGLPATGYYHRDVYPGVLHGAQNNPLFVADGKKSTTYEKVLMTPLVAEPGTVSTAGDVDYMLLGFIVEKVSGVSLDSYVKSVLLNPLELTHTAYNPTRNGFFAENCATTELTGNTRGGLVQFPGVRTGALQGQVHDEIAYYTMEGVAGHAGMFANAEDLAKFGTLFINGGYDQHGLISRAALDATQAPNSEQFANLVGGWCVRGDEAGYSWLTGVSAGRNVLCLSGFTGCLLVVDPENRMAIAYTTNRIGTPITFVDPEMTPSLAYARFSGNYYTSATLGFAPEIIYEGLRPTSAVASAKASYKSAMYDMLTDKAALIAQREALIRRLRGLKADDEFSEEEESLLLASDPMVQAYYALYEVANARIGKTAAKKLAKVYLNTTRDAEFLKKVYKIK